MIKTSVIFVFLLTFSLTVSARVMLPTDEPYLSHGLSDNTVVDMVIHDNAIWLATGQGLSFSLMDNVLWNRYDNTNGLLSNNISAIYSNGQILWVAMNHFVDEDIYATADGLAYTSDNGRTWEFATPDGSVGFVNIVYDITGVDSLVFCASWFGGLLATFDNGQNWKNIYFTVSDSINAANNPNDPPWSNRYFAAVADTLHNDSMILWAGTANGIRRYVYAPDFAKPSSNYIFDLVRAWDYVFICGDSGLTRLKFDSLGLAINVEDYRSAFMRDGLPGLAVTTAFGFGDRLFVGTIDSLSREVVIDGSDTTIDYTRHGDGIGLAISDDSGLTFNTGFTGLDDLIGDNRYPIEFTAIEHHLYLAAYEGGLFRSSDSGDSWVKMYADPLDMTAANRRNVINSIAADSTSLWLGTDSGVVHLFISDSGTVDSSKNFGFTENAATGGRSYKVGVQNYIDTSSGTIDSTAIWTLNHPIDTSVGTYSVHYMIDSGAGANWTSTFGATGFPQHWPLYDIAFDDSVVYIVGDNMFVASNKKTSWSAIYGSSIKDSIEQFINFGSLELNAVLVVQDLLHQDTLDRDTIFVGSEFGLAVSPGPSIRWRIFHANTDPTRFDWAAGYFAPAIFGNFVNVIELQPLDFGESRIWAHTRDTSQSALMSSTLDGVNWETSYIGSLVWNIAFRDSEVYAASSIGLLYSLDTGVTWDTVVNISGMMATVDPPVPFTMDPGQWVTSVAVMGDTLWIGKEDGAAKIAIDDLGTDNWTIYRADPSPGVYAYPVPFSHSRSGRLFFSYNLPQAANVTIEVYDFAMNLVKTVLRDVPHAAGESLTNYWDGLNGRGVPAAIGMYYFKISISSGEEYWGKLVLVP